VRALCARGQPRLQIAALRKAQQNGAAPPSHEAALQFFKPEQEHEARLVQQANIKAE